VKRTDIDIDSAEGRKMALLDNLTTQVNLAWDPSEINAVSSEIEGFDPSDYGFDPSQLEVAGIGDGETEGEKQSTKEPTGVKEDDFDTEQEYEAKVKKGDIWVLGKHRLMCGSCTAADDMKKLMGGERADIAFTSPPYNMMAKGMAKAFDSDKVPDTYGIKDGTYNEFSDALSDEEYTQLLCRSLGQCLTYADEVLFNIGILSGSKMGILNMLSNYKEKFSDIIVWNKDNAMPMGLPSQIHLVSHACEMIFCFNQKGDRAFSHSQWDLGMMTNRIDTAKVNANEFKKIHHATFPVEFPAYVIKWFTEKSVLDCFGGTGTTMIAAEQLGRKCYMMELDPHYCDVIIARWEKLTGEKARKAE
jgi:DNA modification methylase